MRQMLFGSVFFAVFFFSIHNQAVQAATTEAVAGEKEWTMLVYLNGNNDLDSFAPGNLKQMEQVGSTDRINVVVQWASLANKKVQRLHIQKGNGTSVTSPVVQDLGKVDMGDWRNLVDFIEWGVQKYNAKRYFVVVWNHGSGWHLQAKAGTGFRPTDISFDDTTGNAISTAQLGQAMNEAARFLGRKIDLYASDACLMSMAEVASEMAEGVEVFAGSQEVEPGTGWDYATLLKRWNQKPAMGPDELGKLLTQTYVKAYNGGVYSREDVTFSVMDLSQLDGFHQAVEKMGTEMKKLSPASLKTVQGIAAKSQSFTYSDYVDAGDFASRMEKAKFQGLPDVRVFQDVQEAIRKLVLLRESTTKYLPATGVSFWLPSRSTDFAKYSEKYRSLRFHSKTGWGDALDMIAR